MKNWTNLIFKSAFAMILAASVFTSCFDDSEIWDKLGELEARVDSLENNLNNQLDALNGLVEGKIAISSCVMNEDGSCVIELSDGKKFTAMPSGADYSSLVSYVEVDGKKYWATADATGELVTLTDESGNPIPVQKKVEVKLVDGVYYLVIDGKEYVTGYEAEEDVQIFSSCEALTDASGQVYAVKLTVGEGWEVTLTVDGYKGVLFKLSNLNNTVLTEYFIDYGQTQSFLMETKGIVDYVMQIPDGWRVTESVDKLSGEVYAKITAPAKETVAMGAAVTGGDLKVVSVVDGGKAAVTKLSLSTEPFKTYDVTAMKAVIEPYAGVQKFVYGISALASYDKAAVMAKVTEHLTTGAALPDDYFVSDSAIDKSHTEIYPELSVEDTYVFWAVPVLYREGENNEAGFYIKEEMFREYDQLTPISATVEVTAPTLLDAQMTLKVLGARQMFSGVVPKEENALEQIVSNIKNGVYEPVTDAAQFAYAGSVAEYADMLLEKATSYLVWVIPSEEGRTDFAVSDIVYVEFTTLDITAGGSLEVKVQEKEVGLSSITHTVECQDAAMIYYAYLDATVGERNSGESISNETKWRLLTEAETFHAETGNSIDASISDMMPATTMWLYAAAVGKDGKYGKVSCVSATTKPVTFNKIKLKLTKKEIRSEEADIKVAVMSGGTAESYIYWVGRATDPFWVDICQGDKTTAGNFMAANPQHEAIVKAMKNGEVDAEGMLYIKDLAIAKEHVLVVLAKDAEGNYSKAESVSFETLSINLGTNYVAEGTDKWNETKELIEKNIDWDEAYFEPAPSQGMMAAFAFNIKVPTDLTAYISCYGTEAANNGGGKLDIMLELEQTCLAKTTNNPVTIDPETGEYAMLPDWTDDTGRLIQGTMVNIYQMFPHGDPNDGQVTFFASEGHDDTHCDVWNNGECSNYASQMAAIQELQTLEYWINHFKGSAGNFNTGDPSTSRVLKDEENLMKVAKAYQETHIKYYSGMKPMLFVNDGNALRVSTRKASGVDENGNVMDVVTVMLKDLDGNYYDPMYFPVPNHYKK